jgi:nucleoside-diphosphate-sugar epimerase
MRDFWKDKRVLITGADGFQGSHLCDALVERGAKVRALVHQLRLKNIEHLKDKVEIFRGDVLDYQSMIKAVEDMEIIFHLAAITLVPEARAVPQHTFMTNALGTFNTMLACTYHNHEKIIFPETCHQFGFQPDNAFPLKEDTPMNPIDVYGASKMAGACICRAMIYQYGLPITFPRFFNVYGPRQKKEMLIPKIITQALEGKNPIKLGLPSPTRDYLYISDAINGYILVAEKGKIGEAYHFCTGVERKVSEVANEVLKIGGWYYDIYYDLKQRHIDIPRLVGDYSKAKRELGWYPEVSFEGGVEKTIDWFRWDFR